MTATRRPIIEVHSHYKEPESGPITTGDHFYLKDEHDNWLNIQGLQGGGFEITHQAARHGATLIQPRLANQFHVYGEHTIRRET